MSLINDALKKAQRLRHEQQAAAAAAGDALATGPIKKRGKPMRAQSLVLLCAGAAVLVVCSVLATFFLLTHDTPPAPKSSPAPAIKPAPIADASAPPPVIVAPVIPQTGATPAKTSTATEISDAVAPSPTPAAAAATPEVSAVTTTETKAPEVSATPAPSTPAPSTPVANTPVHIATPPPAKAQDVAESPAKEAVNAFLDSLHVSGVRASGADSKVLMNDRVYRLNEIVDRSLGLKLIKVAPDSLTFADAAGATYTKNF